MFGSRWGTACKVRCWQRCLGDRLNNLSFTSNTREGEKSIEELAGLVAVAAVGVDAGVVWAKIRRDYCDCLCFIV